MHANKKKVNIVTLGCSKNVVDSEKIATHLHHGGYDISHNQDGKGYDTVIINTCGFIEKAKEESIQNILEWTEEKKTGNVKRVIVTGCLSHRYHQELSTEIPEVDAWFGTMDMSNLLREMNTDYTKNLLGERLISTPSHYAYLKISEGCNRTCSFCAIPMMRGKHVSRRIEDLVEEAKALAASGVKELILIAQELTYYGLDLYQKRSLHLLLQELVKVDGIAWIRLHYAYPHKFPMEIIETMQAHEKICNYLDIPLQHASDRMLQSMRRQITRAEMSDLLHAIRHHIPNIALRTTMIIGYPDEKEQDFDELFDFVSEQKFDRLGVFLYSHEQGTSAFSLEDNVPQQVKQRRYDLLMEKQAEISLEKNERMLGETLKVIVDKKEGEFYIGRTEKDSPEVDNEVVITSPKKLSTGQFVEVKITNALEYDLEGTTIND